MSTVGHRNPTVEPRPAGGDKTGMFRAFATSLAAYAMLAKLALALLVFLPADSVLAGVICGPAAAEKTDAQVPGALAASVHCTMCLAVAAGEPPAEIRLVERRRLSASVEIIAADRLSIAERRMPKARAPPLPFRL